MKEFNLGNEYRFIQKSSSKGTQIKYYKAGYWYKVDRLGNESAAEFLASTVLLCSDTEDFVSYEMCRINGRTGCRSKNFLHPEEEFLTFQNLFSIYRGGSLANQIQQMQDVQERIQYVKKFLLEAIGYDCSHYLRQVLTLDMLLLNEDRHFHNLGVLRTPNGYRNAPIFDNGNSLLSDFSRYPVFLTEKEWLEEIPQIAALPFSGSFEQQALAAGIGLHLDYVKLDRLLKKLPECRAKSVLQYQLKRYKKELSIN